MSDALRRLLRERLRPLKAATEMAPARGDFDLDPEHRPPGTRTLRPAAVLVPIVLRASGPTMLFTRRADTLPQHAGQVSFPGGRIEARDAGPAGAALREAQEEIGLDPAFVELAGLLDAYETGTGFSIAPVVGLVREGFDLHPDTFEVAEIFEAPFDFLMDPANHRKHSAVWQGRMRTYYAMPYGRHYIWGATAGMIVDLSERLSR